MKKTINITEEDLHKIVKESVERIISEGNFWDNARNAVKGNFWNNAQNGVNGAIRGYQANKQANNDLQSNKTAQEGKYVAQEINNLYKTAGMLAQEWKKYGNRSTNYGGWMNYLKQRLDYLENYFSRNTIQY